MKFYFHLFTCLLILSACGPQQSKRDNAWVPDTAGLMTMAARLDTVTFAGGCFWCTEAYFERVDGVHYVVSGYAGGKMEDPTYHQVSAGRTDHAESVQLYYDSEKLSYNDLLRVFFATMDPTQLNRQGPDVGAQYRSIVFYHNKEQQQQAEAFIRQLDASGKYNSPVVTTVEPYRRFYEAESYHQDYYRRNPGDAYVKAVTRPKVKKFEKEFQDMLKAEYQK